MTPDDLDSAWEMLLLNYPLSPPELLPAPSALPSVPTMTSLIAPVVTEKKCPAVSGIPTRGLMAFDTTKATSKMVSSIAEIVPGDHGYATSFNDVTTSFNDVTTSFNDVTTSSNDVTTSCNDVTTPFNDVTTHPMTPVMTSLPPVMTSLPIQ